MGRTVEARTKAKFTSLPVTPIRGTTAKLKAAKNGHVKAAILATTPGSVPAIDSRELEEQCLELRKRAYSYREIGKELNISSTAAYKAVMRILDRMEAELKEPAKRVREVELQKLDAIEKVITVKARNGDMFAVDRLLKVAERRARLTGIDMPVKTQVLGDADNPLVFKELPDQDLERELNSLVTIIGFKSLPGTIESSQDKIIDVVAGEETPAGSQEP